MARKTTRAKRQRTADAAAVMPDEKMKPRLTLDGTEAKALHAIKPGGRVRLMVNGRLLNVGLRSYGERVPTAEIEIDHTKVMGRRRGAMADEGGC